MYFEPFKTPPRDLHLEPGQIHVWSASLDQSDSCFQMLYKTLSQEERDRAGRFVFEIDRRRFIICRGILRLMIARYLNVDAGSLSFKYGPNGKPALDDLCLSGALFFNLSHSEEIALYAFSPDNEVGVDVEYMRDIYEMDRIAERIFSSREIEIFRALSGRTKKEAFFNGWTRKEAISKALGDGLSLSLHSFDVSFIAGKPAKPISLEGNSGKIPELNIQDLKPASDYAGALAVKDTVFETRHWQWELN